MLINTKPYHIKISTTLKIIMVLAILFPFTGCQNETPTVSKEVRKKIAVKQESLPADKIKKNQNQNEISDKKSQSTTKSIDKKKQPIDKKNSSSSDPEPISGATPLRPPMIAVDPFKSIIQRERPDEESKAEAAKTKSRKREPQTPLERMHLSQFKLTAIYKTPAGYKALVEEPNGKGYVINEGDWIGTNAGIVQEVTDESVIIEEEVKNAIGDITLTITELKLPNPFGE